MSKELTPLEAVKKIREINYFKDDEEVIEDCFGLEEYLSIIETALKRLEQLEKAFVSLSKEDEKTKKLLSLEIEKNRALEIIKEKNVCIHDFKSKTLKEYNGCREWEGELTQEEYELLTEVLL